MPAGVTTILGGAIQNVDPVLDEISVHAYGMKPMKILYGERTQVYRNGVRIPVFDLESEQDASIETVLDGWNVFAVSIHILSQALQGDCQGLVLSYNRASGELAVNSALSPEPVHVYVRANTPISRVGERSFTKQQSGV